MTETPEQRVARLQAELAEARVDALNKELAAAQAGVPTAPPNRPVSPQQVEQLRAEFGQAFGDAMSWSGGGGAGGARFGPPSADDARLAPAPRDVPFAYRAMVLPFSFWSLFALFMIAVAPIALYIAVPRAGVIAAGVGLVAVCGRLVCQSLLRTSLLRWGEVATVVKAEVLSRGTYYSGTTVQNVRMAQARGWQVTRRWYSGPVTRTRVTYDVRGTQGTVVVRGLDYVGGIILADSRRPGRALCVSSFPYDLARDPAGNWTGVVAARSRLGSLAMIVLVLGWTAAMALGWWHAAAGVHGWVR